MRSILMFAALLFVGGGILARYADQAVIAHPPARAAAVRPASPAQPGPSGSRSMVLTSDRAGHFRVDANIDGRSLDFVVDTGASYVVLRESAAARVGIRPMPRDYTALMSTANGTIKAARVRLNRVEIGSITIYDVAAMVLPDEALGQNLLGVSFLSRLRRYEYANGRMIIEQ